MLTKNHTKMLRTNENDWELRLHLSRCSGLDWSSCLHHCFHKSPFSPVQAKKKAFSKLHFSKTLPLEQFSKVSVFVILFDHFSVDDNKKHIKKYAWDLWMGPKFMNLLPWAMCITSI